MKYFINLSIVVSLTLLLGGCGATGKQFSVFKTRESKSVVYFYRPDSFMSQPNKFNIFEVNASGDYEKNMHGSKTIGSLKNNSYLAYYTEPGNHLFTDNMMKTPIQVNVKPNDYVCFRLTTGLLNMNTFELVDKTTCKNEIKSTNQMTQEDLESSF